MAFVLRRPLSLSSALVNPSKRLATPLTSLSAPVRALHGPPLKSSSDRFFALKAQRSVTALSNAKEGLRQSFRRAYMQETYRVPRPDAGNLRQRLLYGAGLFAGTMLAINLVFNRETREDGGMPVFERSYLNETFMHTGLGIGIIGVAARALHTSGWSYRLMATNPWAVVGLGLAASIGTMYGTFATAPDK